MNGWSGITTVQRASKDRDEDSGGFYFFFRQATTPARWSAGESPAPAHRRNFKACFFRSNKSLGPRALGVGSSVLPQGAEITKSTGGFHQTFIVLRKAK